MPGKPALTPRQKASIIADWGSGLPIPQIAKKYHRTAATIHSYVNPLRESETKPEIVEVSRDWRGTLRRKGVAAVEAGLDCTADPYRRAEVGVKTLKGLGEFEADQKSVTMMIADTPREWRESFCQERLALEPPAAEPEKR